MVDALIHAERKASVFDTQVPQREDLKNYFGNVFAQELYGYQQVWSEIASFLMGGGECDVA